MAKPICDGCIRKNGCDAREGRCNAYEELQRIYQDERFEERTEIIKHLRTELDIRDAEVADDLRAIAEQIIDRLPDMQYIDQYGIKVGYVRSYERKMEDGKCINADCRKVSKIYGSYLPYDFIITFYEPNVCILSENQQKILMLHELKHIGVGIKGLKLEPHDIEDFKDILEKYGMEWNEFQKEVPDILADE